MSSARPRPVARGEIWLVNLDPTVGREIRKTRPVLIVSPPELHDYLDSTIIAPITSGSIPAPYRIETALPKKPGRIVLDQIRTIDNCASSGAWAQSIRLRSNARSRDCGTSSKLSKVLLPHGGA